MATTEDVAATTASLARVNTFAFTGFAYNADKRPADLTDNVLASSLKFSPIFKYFNKNQSIKQYAYTCKIFC